MEIQVLGFFISRRSMQGSDNIDMFGADAEHVYVNARAKVLIVASKFYSCTYNVRLKGDCL